jgi:hypothetical protein
MFVSYDLRAGGGFSACRGAEHIRLGSGLHAAVEPGQGLVSARRGRGLDLRFSRVTAQAAWMELGLKLGGAGQGRSDRAWRDSSQFYCRLRLALQADPQVDSQVGVGADPQRVSQGEAPPARLALRLHLREGFEDIFAPDPLPLSREFNWVRAEIHPPVWLLSQAQAVDLHLFLPPRDGALQVSDLAVTAVS